MKTTSLNHVYRLVWSQVNQVWTAVAETAKGQGKKSVVTDSRTKAAVQMQVLTGFKFKTVAALAGMLCANMVYALPDNIVTDYGSMTTKTSAAQMILNQTSQKYIGHTSGFNIASNESVYLNQPVNGMALIRILGNNPTEIYGHLNATGQLFLINPNGVIFGGTANVSVGSIVASALNITNKDFLQNNFQFQAGAVTGDVINRGVIKAKDDGYIVMLGKTVDNSGTLVANNGSVVLASAQTAVLDFYGNGLVKANLTAQAAEAVIKNSGRIQADGGLVQMATNARSAAINVSGIVEANQLVQRDGVIRLEGGDNSSVTVTGQLIAQGVNTTGGTIEVTGEQIAVMNGASLNASGDTGGGTIMVGGDYQGKNDAIYNATTTYVSSDASIVADAIKQGDGGKVIVWANDLTGYFGNISSQGGASGGNGGFVEVSGKQNLEFQGAVNVAAVNGTGGTVLLDPANIILSNASTPSLFNQATGTPDISYASPGTTTTINVGKVSGFDQLYLQATNDITVSNALTMTNLQGSILFQAGHDVNINAAVTAGSSTGSVQLEAGNNININANTTSGQFGTVTLTADADNSGAGNIAIGANITGSAGVTLSAVNITHTAGNINTTGNTTLGLAGSVTINATGDVDLGNANINAYGTTYGSAAGANGGTVNITANSFSMTGNINTSGSDSAVNNGIGGQGGAVTINTANNASVGNITTGAGSAGSQSTISALSGSVAVTSKGGSISTGNISANGGANDFGGNVTLTASSGTVTAGTINTNAGAMRNNKDGVSAGDINISAGQGITLSTINASGANGNGANQSGGNAGRVTLVSTAGDINMAAITSQSGAGTGTGKPGLAADIFVQAGQDVIMNGNVQTNSTAATAVQIVAGRNFVNTSNSNITTGTGGNWTVYSHDPIGTVKGSPLTASYDYVQYGTKFGGKLLGTGNGFIYQISPTVTASLSGTATKVFDGNNTVTDLTGLAVTTTASYNGTALTDKVQVSPLTGAVYDNAAVGTGKPITSSTGFTLVSAQTAENKPIYNGYTAVTTTSTATGSIVAATTPTAPVTFSSPRDNAGIGGLVPNNPLLNVMTIVSLNPAAGNDDPDAVACPVNEDRMGGTPILSSGVKLPDGVSANCI